MKNPLVALFVVAIILVAIWEAVWKIIAMWKCGRHGQLAWYICIAVFNTAGILPIVYLLWFQRRDLPVGVA